MESSSPPSALLKRPLLLPLASIVAGITAGGLFSPLFPEFFLIPLICIAFFTIFLKHWLPFYLALSVILFCWGDLALEPFLSPELPDNHIARFVSDDPLIVEGVVDSRPEGTEHGSRVCLNVEKIIIGKKQKQVSGRLMVFIKEGRTELLTGDRIRFASRISRPRNYGLPGEFDHEAFLAFQKVYATAFVKQPGYLILMRAGVAFPVQRSIDAAAVGIGAFIEHTVPATEAAILRALLIGDSGFVPKTIKDAYSRTGVNHILSISGFHVGIIALFMYQILMLAARSSEKLLIHFNLRRIIYLLILPVLIFYLFLSGAAPATSRSVFMVAVFILGLLLEREIEQTQSLMLAALFLLALSPPLLFSVSFQLSFFALWGLVVLPPLFMAPFKGIERGVPGKVLVFLMASVAATLATALPVAYYFHRVSASGIISNFFIVPLMGYGAVILGFSALPMMFIAPIGARILLSAAAFLIKISNGIITILDKIPVITSLNPSRMDLLCGCLLLSVLTFLNGKRQQLVCGIIVLCISAGSHLMTMGTSNKQLEINFFSVGQGESTLITFPDGRRMLLDGGGSARDGGIDVGERLLAPALRKLGVRKLDWIVLTHPHPDHLQGLKYVAANFPVGEFWEGIGDDGNKDYRELCRIIAERKIPVRRITDTTPTITVADVRIEALAPIGSSVIYRNGEAGDPNNDSVVLRLAIGTFSALFTGDIGAETESQLLSHPEKLNCTLLKIPHHGSRFSSTAPFLDAASPRIALIGAGYHNSFHLPAQETIDKLITRHARIFRTDMDGTIRILCDQYGKNVTCETYSGHFR
jgi:competence protein ComEC